MATKRKLDASPPSGAARTRPHDVRLPTSPQDSEEPAENYPRKRIAIACNVCRFRKTRCDAVKPSCGFCTDLGIECTYRKPTMGDRAKQASNPPEALSSLERRLSQLEARVESTQQMMQSTSILSPNVSNASEMIESQDSTSRRSSMNRSAVEYLSAPASNPAVGTPVSYDFAYRQTATEATTARPSLLTFRAPYYINVESWDYTAEFYDDEIQAGERLCDQFDNLALQPLDLTKRTTRRLQQSFVENFLRWTPIFDQKTCASALDRATVDGFMGQNATSCLTFMFLALGAISEDRSEDPENQAPGLDYFARGCQILERLSLRTGNLTVLQCRVLQASYFKFAIRPLQTWNSITQAARDCMHLLTSRSLERMDQQELEALHRAFWACSTILHELEATMKMHPIGLRHFHEMVPLPQFEEEDSGFYFFLAQISLRKFLTQSLEVVGYHSGKVIYAPVVTKELRKQVREWYDHLPSVVRFPIDSTPVFDTRKSFLRGQYFALFVVLGWPSVLKILESGQAEGSSLDSESLSVTKEQAAGCIKGCCSYLSIADEQLMGRKMGTHFTLWATYATLATLIITFNCPCLAFIEETRQEHHIRNGYEILRPWEHLPMIRRGLERARIMMAQAGLVDSNCVDEYLPSQVVNVDLKRRSET
ncbi:hypothetical protein BU24DRAFT_23177 [Aaosphaeria arxii CBS 175.79]|uniref:Zn(2)-C6 fungal-type domain-containing protein n=1 Tax=Aaosphaeria arxii CBS 175.79 TaxID=1450172 RepID=A0A6A5Y8N3_9PLEO|nr:uncharacterized protein BU24DRAFT_23177 [Aaosphaeria arxii CBS 175.79]KAF2021583.1 hypothetical protein BU24DRAFT_23177 [Aaosphaeria arxii CBS 175.79]